jgi:hypothetical protein
MKKTLLLFSIILCFFACKGKETQPVEKTQGFVKVQNGQVVIDEKP